MKRQCAKVINNGIYTVIEDTERKEKRYAVYFAANGQRLLDGRYECLTDALLRLVELINGGCSIGCWGGFLR